VAEARRDYYDRMAIGYVSRPPHGKDGFQRAGRFKKASNMNFALALSLRVEEIMTELGTARRSETEIPLETTFEADYKQAFDQAVQETEGKAQADGDIRM
jgi:hypothetical protein